MYFTVGFDSDRFFFVYNVTGSTYSRIILQFVQNFERNWKNSICIRVNNFAKSANFEI